MATKKVVKKKTAGAKKPAAKKAKSPKKAAAAPDAPAKRADGVVARATVKHVRISPRKCRLVINMIKGKQVEPALQILRFSPKKGARFAVKLLEAAIANAREQSGVDIDKLWVTGAFVDMGRTLKRYIPAAHGRATPNMKRSSHITLLLGERP